MRRTTISLLLIACIPLVAFSCSPDVSEYCYSEDQAGVVRDSVRPDPGYVCIASATVSNSGVAPDSVRPDPGSVSVRLRTARRADVH